MVRVKINYTYIALFINLYSTALQSIRWRAVQWKCPVEAYLYESLEAAH